MGGVAIQFANPSIPAAGLIELFMELEKRKPDSTMSPMTISSTTTESEKSVDAGSRTAYMLTRLKTERNPLLRQYLLLEYCQQYPFDIEKEFARRGFQEVPPTSIMCSL